MELQSLLYAQQGHCDKHKCLPCPRARVVFIPLKLLSALSGVPVDGLVGLQLGIDYKGTLPWCLFAAKEWQQLLAQLTALSTPGWQQILWVKMHCIRSWLHGVVFFWFVTLHKRHCTCKFPTEWSLKRKGPRMKSLLCNGRIYLYRFIHSR